MGPICGIVATLSLAVIRSPGSKPFTRPQLRLSAKNGANDGQDWDSALKELNTNQPRARGPPEELLPPARLDAFEFARIILAEMLVYMRAATIQAARRASRSSRSAIDAERKRLAYIEPQAEWTLAEVAQHDGATADSGPILLAADGEVFNVGTGRNFYGPGGEYALFAGRDATRLLAKMRTELESDDEAAKPLSIAERLTLAGWVFTLRSKYELVGRLAPELAEMGL
jgi:membrane-associated progesterone receptor component